MNKDKFINSFNNADKIILSNIYDKIILANKIPKVIYCSEFYTPNIWKRLLEMRGSFNINTYCFGIFEESERRMLAFSNDFYSELEYPLDLLKIKLKSSFTNIKHKDFLGAILGLGIKREKLGDLILEGKTCYAAVSSDVSDYIIYNLQSIGSSPCLVQKVDMRESSIPCYDFEDKIIIMNSNRLDAFVSRLCNISRSKSVELIKNGKVLIDYACTNKKDVELRENFILTIRGYGKFKIDKQVGFTQKGKIKVLVKKFI
ncbi:RNA-binding protein [Haloimpatiens sp. FM7330]|uniref:YlmH family RNA-binding protein n=1 Tax=Haloimpatiens sp. FM7330 TaxID=3298610 RepID=UPI003626301C